MTGAGKDDLIKEGRVFEDDVVCGHGKEWCCSDQEKEGLRIRDEK